MRVFSRWGEDLGADCGRYHPCRNRAGFEPCVHVASPSVSSVLLASKRSEVGCPRRGSNPARQNLGEKPIQGAPRFSPHHTLGPINYCPSAVTDPCPPGSWILAPGSLLILITDYLVFEGDHEITQYVNSVSASPYLRKTYGQNSAAFTSKERQRPSRFRA
jgi:hypothetical protein